MSCRVAKKATEKRAFRDRLSRNPRGNIQKRYWLDR